MCVKYCLNVFSPWKINLKTWQGKGQKFSDSHCKSDVKVMTKVSRSNCSCSKQTWDTDTKMKENEMYTLSQKNRTTDKFSNYLTILQVQYQKDFGTKNRDKIGTSITLVNLWKKILWIGNDCYLKMYQGSGFLTQCILGLHLDIYLVWPQINWCAHSPHQDREDPNDPVKSNDHEEAHLPFPVAFQFTGEL